MHLSLRQDDLEGPDCRLAVDLAIETDLIAMPSANTAPRSEHAGIADLSNPPPRDHVVRHARNGMEDG
jgi:hypothetical protein